MSGARSVEYFLVVGVDDSTQSSSSHTGEDASSVVSPVSPMSPLSEHTSRGEHSLATYLQCAIYSVHIPGNAVGRGGLHDDYNL